MKRRDLLCVAAVAAFALPPLAAAQQKMVMKATDVHALGYPTVEAVVRMGKKLEAQTNGRLSIQMFPAMQLGGEKEMIEQAQVGALQIARISVGPMGPIVDELNVFNLPFMFRDEAHMRKVIDGPIGQELLDKLTAAPNAKLVGLCWMDAGTRSVYAKKPITGPGRPQGPEDPHDGQPDLRRDDERDGRERRRDGLQRAVQRAPDRRRRRRGEQPAVAADAEPLPGHQVLQPDRPPDHPRDARVLEGELGQAVQGRSGPDRASSRARRRWKQRGCGT